MTDILDRCVFLIGRQRSGTTVLRRTLETHADIVDLGEVMHPGRQVGFYSILAEKLAQDPASGIHNKWFGLLEETLQALTREARPSGASSSTSSTTWPWPSGSGCIAASPRTRWCRRSGSAA